jgi:hypothetical protein
MIGVLFHATDMEWCPSNVASLGAMSKMAMIVTAIATVPGYFEFFKITERNVALAIDRTCSHGLRKLFGYSFEKRLWFGHHIPTFGNEAGAESTQ